MANRTLLSVLAILLLAGVGWSQDAPIAADGGDDEKGGLSPEQMVDLAKKFEGSMAIVEYSLQMDKGEAPTSLGGWGYQSLGRLILEERPLAVPGFLIDTTHVFAPDSNIHPRFVEGMSVKIGGKTIKAKIASVLVDNYASIIELSEPVEGVTPVTFDAKAEGPYLTVGGRRQNGRWLVEINSLPGGVAAGEGLAEQRARPYCLIVNETGTAVGVSMSGQLAPDGSWKGSPADRKAMSAEQLAELLTKTETGPAGAVHRVTLKFRSPQQKGGIAGMSERVPTEVHVPGIVLADGRVLVLANMPPKVTARLEEVLVHFGKDTTVKATFVLTLKDYGAFLAKLPDGGKFPVADLATGDIRDCENKLVAGMEFRIQGEQETVYYQHRRVETIQDGWRGNLYPSIRGEDDNVLLFDLEGRLLAFPIARRMKTASSQYSDERKRMTAAAQLAPVLADAVNHADESNIPLSEEEENRIAWMGVILQPMDAELARLKNVADLTRDGSTGAIVSYVYEDSPAAKAGVEAGWILIRLHVADEPAPIEVKAPDAERSPFRIGFPELWKIYKDLPEQYFEFVPRPWSVAENSFTRTLTDLGFGRKYTADFFHDGKLDQIEFTIVASPPHYDSAAKFKYEPLGLTVKNTTFEVDRYFLRHAGDPGVIISRIEPGSKASTAGLKPYEIITTVNDKPVGSIEDFKALTSDGGTLNLGVKRWKDGRVVKVEAPVAGKPEDATTQPAEKSEVEASSESQADVEATAADKAVDAPEAKTVDEPDSKEAPATLGTEEAPAVPMVP